MVIGKEWRWKIGRDKKKKKRKRVKAAKMTYLTNSRSGSSSPSRRATIAIVVLSPPGIMRASHCESWAVVRTWIKLNCGACVEKFVDSWAAAFWRREMCSITPPWRASTPTVICLGVTASTVIVSVSIDVVCGWQWCFLLSQWREESCRLFTYRM